MPDRGLLELSAIQPGVIASPRDWTFTGARWAQITYEVSLQAALGRLPADVTRPVPCYARLLILEAAGSPAGPLRLAALSAGGRYRLLGKNVLVDVLVDGPADAVAAAFGAPFRQGRISFEREGLRLSAAISDDSYDLARLSLPALRAVDPAMLRWDPWLGFALGDAVPQLVEYGPAVNPTEAFLSKGAVLDIPATLPRNHLWRTFRNLNTISACYEEGELTLSAPVVQQRL